MGRSDNVGRHALDALGDAPIRSSAMRRKVVSRWRSRDPVDKFLAYNRWSLQTTVALFGCGFGVAAGPGWALGAIVVSAALGVATLRTHPALRVGPLERPRRRLGADAAVHLALMVVGVAVAEPLVVASCLITMLLAVTPFMQRGAFLTLLTGAAGALALASWTGNFGLGLLCVVVSSVTPVMLWTVRIMLEAHRARFLEAQLRVSEERLRFAEDLHDTLGQNLAALSIKAQLATKFAERDDARLTAELAGLRALVDATVADVRKVVTSYNSPDLARELSGAAALLRAAGIAVAITGSAGHVAPGGRDVAAWFIRETATNVLHHADAHNVWLELGPRRIVVTNDAPRPGTRAGSGLRNLSRRAEAIGGTIRVEHTADTFAVTLELP